MLNIKISVGFRLLLLALPLFACAILQNSPAPTPVGTVHPSATQTVTLPPAAAPKTATLKVTKQSATPTAKGTLKPTSPTQAARRTALFLTQAATKGLTVNTSTAGPTPTGPTPTSTQSITPIRVASRTATITPTITPTPEFPRIDYAANIPAPALSNNILAESMPRDLLIYLPASYGQPEKRYPVVYYLLDFGLKVKDVTIPLEKIQKDVAVGLAKEQIIVFVSGTNSLGGSFYVNSPVTGDWDTYIAGDVVRYIDATYYTLPKPTSRGLSGYAMGGFGALSVAMRHPDVFGAVYSISPTLFDEGGLALSPMFNSRETVDAVLDLQVRQQSMSVTEGISDMQHAGAAQLSIAYGAAFAPNPQSKPPYIDYPYYRQNGRILRDEATWKRWEAGFGAAPDRIQAHKAGLLRLTSIVLACGPNPPYVWIVQGCKAFSTYLTSAGIANQLLPFPGGVEPGIEQSIRGFILPFFAEKLSFEP